MFVYVCRIIKKIEVGRKNKIQFFENVEIIDVGAEGKAIARINNKVVFVPYVVPGDIVDLRIVRRKKNYLEGRVINFVKKSDEHLEAFCKHYGICGGCKWQHMSYVNQLKYKQKQVIDNLERIGKIDIGVVNTILPSEYTKYYRNKLEFTFSNKRWLTKEEIDNESVLERNALGFHVAGMFDKVVDIEECFLQPNPSNDIRLALKKYAIDNNLQFFDLRSQEGFLRNVIIRNSINGELMIIVVFYKEDKKKREDILNFLKKRFPEIKSLMYAINGKANDSLSDQEIIHFAGKSYIIEQMGNLKFKVGPKSFYQTNSNQACQLYKTAFSYAGLTGSEIVYDLYTGTGTIANFIAQKAKKVVGIEYIAEAITDAKENSNFNNITNTHFFAGDIKDILNVDFIKKHGKPDVIITDPPRAGMHKNVIQSILYSNPEKIVYVSCNPATQARDIELLSEKYKVTEIQPVDMFPQTHHVENVALLIRKEST
ncbi:MAG: 23S rRNA (uracil(1939)-C(5))-methyltransferase RlmD [Chlorobi bacterium]|nr:23S rRNA (uracil(1939)-C(5))-methyltransferase RlmD [Chlorobiota bacterium]